MFGTRCSWSMHFCRIVSVTILLSPVVHSGRHATWAHLIGSVHPLNADCPRPARPPFSKSTHRQSRQCQEVLCGIVRWCCAASSGGVWQHCQVGLGGIVRWCWAALSGGAGQQCRVHLERKDDSVVQLIQHPTVADRTLVPLTSFARLYTV